jgi:hypothetical protein
MLEQKPAKSSPGDKGKDLAALTPSHMLACWLIMRLGGDHRSVACKGLNSIQFQISSNPARIIWSSAGTDVCIMS